MRKGIKYLSFSLLVIILLFFVIDFLNLQSRRRLEYSYRQTKLSLMQEEITEYINKGNLIPDSLYIYCKDVERILFTSISVVSSHFEDHSLLLNDPNLFGQQVPYSILKDDQGWYIREKRGGHYFKDMFMIDDKGKIYIIKEYK